MAVGAGKLGVVAADNCLDMFARLGMLDLIDRAGLTSCCAFFVDLVPVVRGAFGLADRAGDGSRDARGEGTAEEAADPWDSCDGCLVDGHDSVLPVGLMVLVVVESGEKVGCEDEERLLASVEPLPILLVVDLSMVANMESSKGRVKEI